MIIQKDSPDFRFVILENTKNTPDFRILNYTNQNRRLKANGNVSSILQFNEITSKTFSIIDEDLFFCPDFPEFLLPKTDPSYCSSPQVKNKVITWGVIRSEPGTVSSDPPFTGTRELVPRHREYIALFGNEESKYVVGNTSSELQNFGGLLAFIKADAQYFDNLVQYNIWSKSNYEVEELTEWFQDYMLKYRGMYRELGISNMYFDRRLRDNVINQMNNGYHSRSILYYVRTERVTLHTTYPIKQINLNVNVNTIQDIISDLDLKAYDSMEIENKVLKKWINMNQLGG